MEVISSLFYYERENHFVDEDGFPVICDLYKWITPDEFMMFRLEKETWYIPRGNQGLIELIYPDSDDMEE